MNILNIEHISKIFGEKSFFVMHHSEFRREDKVGIIGINGTGKTTLLRMIAGVEEPDSGQIIKQNGIRLAYLSQHPSFPEGATVLSYAFDGIAENDWALKSEVKSALDQTWNYGSRYENGASFRRAEEKSSACENADIFV